MSPAARAARDRHRLEPAHPPELAYPPEPAGWPEREQSGPPPAGEVAARVLACVEAIPVGKVLTYGDVAEYVGSRSARQVGRVLALDGGTVPWHRVLKADGSMAPQLADEQRQLLIGDGIRFEGARVRLADYRWDGQ